MDFIELEVINWSKFNPRKDIRFPRWFAMSNRILEQSDLFCLDAEQFRCFVYILCQASQQGTYGSVRICTDHAKQVCRISIQLLESTLILLEKAQCIRRPVRVRTRSERDSTIQDSTVQYKEGIHPQKTKKTFEEIRATLPILSIERWKNKKDSSFVEKEIKSAIEYYMAEPGHESWPPLTWVKKINAWIARSEKMRGGAVPIDWKYVFGEKDKA